MFYFLSPTRKPNPKPKCHVLKLLQKYADAKVTGEKSFEIRDVVDRAFTVGDHVRYKVVDKDGKVITHHLSNLVFEITYISTFMQRNNYVVFADKLLGYTPDKI